jgi:hypothetical protein
MGMPYVHPDFVFSIVAPVLDVAKESVAVLGVPVLFQNRSQAVLRQTCDKDGTGARAQFQRIHLRLADTQVIDGIRPRFGWRSVVFAVGFVAASEQ